MVLGLVLTVLFVTLLGVLAFGLSWPFRPLRAARAAAGGVLVGLIAAYFNFYPGSPRGAIGLMAAALILGGVRLAAVERFTGNRTWMSRLPAVGVAVVVLLILTGLFPYTEAGAKSVGNSLYGELNANVEKGSAPALTSDRDVRVVPWDLAGRLFERAYGEDASYLDASGRFSLRNTYPDTVNGEFLWVHAPVPETSKWLLGGRFADKVLYVHNNATNLTPAAVPGTLAVHLDGVFWQDRLARHGQEHGSLRYIMQDIALQLDDDRKPYWIAYLARIDWRGQPHLEKLLVVDAHTGAESTYAPSDAPAWIEMVYPENYVYQWANYWGGHREGVLYRWFNADRLVAPDDVTVRYIRLEDKTYWLLPMKQLRAPQLGGYILVDTRTGEATFYDRFDLNLIDYDTALLQLRAIMQSGQATGGQGLIQLAVSEGYVYPIQMRDGTVRDAYIFPLLEGLKIARFAIIDAQDYNVRRVFATSLDDALKQFASQGTDAQAPPPVDMGGNVTRETLPVVDGFVEPGKAVVNLNGTLYRVTPADLALGDRLEPDREMDELSLAIARANRGETVEIDVLLRGGRVLDVVYRGVAWG